MTSARGDHMAPFAKAALAYICGAKATIISILSTLKCSTVGYKFQACPYIRLFPSLNFYDFQSNLLIPLRTEVTWIFVSQPLKCKGLTAPEVTFIWRLFAFLIGMIFLLLWLSFKSTLVNPLLVNLVLVSLRSLYKYLFSVHTNSGYHLLST